MTEKGKITNVCAECFSQYGVEKEVKESRVKLLKRS